MLQTPLRHFLQTVAIPNYTAEHIKTHGSESRGQGGSTSRRTQMSILQEQTLLK